MCMVTYVPAGVETPIKGISNGSIINNDGHGWTVARGDQLLVGKSMNFDEALDGMLEARRALGIGALAMFHSRYGTHGEMGEYNIHPFHFDEDSVMAHNGILPAAYHPKWKDRRSDTRIFVDRIAGYVNNPNGVPSRRGAARLGSMIGLGNKLVFVSTRSGQPKVRIVNADAGVQTGGVWYSNYGFETDYSWHGWSNRGKGGTYTIGGVRPGFQNLAWGMDDEPFDPDGAVSDLSVGKELEVWSGPVRCENCGSKDLDHTVGICMECVTCLDCWDNYNNCLCYRPGGNFTDRSWIDPADDEADANDQDMADEVDPKYANAEAEYADVIALADRRLKNEERKRERIPTIG